MLKPMTWQNFGFTSKLKDKHQDNENRGTLPILCKQGELHRVYTSDLLQETNIKAFITLISKGKPNIKMHLGLHLRHKKGPSKKKIKK